LAKDSSGCANGEEETSKTGKTFISGGAGIKRSGNSQSAGTEPDSVSKMHGRIKMASFISVGIDAIESCLVPSGRRIYSLSVQRVFMPSFA
jgi:hypothetical protein